MQALRYLFIATVFILVSCSKFEKIAEQLKKDQESESIQISTTTIAGGSCESGERRKDANGCNSCMCTDGAWACTEKACSDMTSQECLESLPEDLAALIDKAYAENRKQRDIALERERQRLNVTMLKPSAIVGSTESFNTTFRPLSDPYPQSIVAVGDPSDIRKEGYEINHGKMGMTRIYETYPGSQQYFIVDLVGGDGHGGNGEDVAAESIEYAASPLRLAELGNSWHSWHVSPDNYIVRATQKPIDQLQQEVKICGCGHARNEIDVQGDAGADNSSYADRSTPVYKVGIFLLPGDQLPTMGDEDSFEAEFEREHYKKIYVPAKGKVCQAIEIAC